ncbi:hypothetical protein BU24DRAFT_450670 [Aaosphaeria arxii CBS 175.79]|uniref:Fungal N-terminal domain-containing protein n=1 Tax=Aaosphaeria arxii CBS 175.79 TaxID=1450172 RepID=A0A6A5XUZ2_9PLEO|nr:uncharacterized protein BU24DRAFT_450670 [Aaosphaeria arxii CBS 175.79]KAF2016064.1 hypothetical protein BU24DRAFT_450670 [Aaosphaeria arxii CBS 175.79]
MADFGAIFALYSRGSALSLDLYKHAATARDGKFLCQLAKSVSNFSLTVKQIGTIIRQDDSLPSAEAIQVLHDLFDQCSLVLDEISDKTTTHQETHAGKYEEQPGHHQRDAVQLSEEELARFRYIYAHLEALKCTIRIVLQTLFTAQSIIWARVQPSISPKRAEAAVTNEKNQLESLVIEQQIAILSASSLYHSSRVNERLITEGDSSQSLTLPEKNSLTPTDLVQYQHESIISLDTADAQEEAWMPSICAISGSHADHVLSTWTRLRQLHDNISDIERQRLAEQRETQQPTVESDSDDEAEYLREDGTKIGTPTPRRPGSVQPLFTENTTLPIPVPTSKFGPTAPISPVSSYGASPRSSIASLPVEAAAAVEAKVKDEDISLEIPWRLVSGSYYWDYIDGTVQDTNTEKPSSFAFSDRRSWTEISALWVCKEAIQEARFEYHQLQKSRQDDRRTKLEACFKIDQALTFAQVQRLVERTVEIYRQNLPPSPPPPRRSSFERPSASRPVRDRDQDRTPLASLQPTTQKTHPPLERSRTAYAYPPPPPLDRSSSMPGPRTHYPPPPPGPIPHNVNPQLPPRPGHQPLQTMHYPAQPASYFPLPPPPPFSPTSAIPSPAGHGRIPLSPQYPQFPPRQPQPTPVYRPEYQPYRSEHYSSTSTTSDSENNGLKPPREKNRERSHRSRSRRPSSSSHRKKHSSSTVGTLAKVGGLAALLDGIVEMGVL